MVGEEFGWYPLDGLAITILLLEMLVVIMIPGFLLSLALFPKRAAMPMSERLALSFGLGLAPPFILMMLNMFLRVPVTFVTSAIAFATVSALGFLLFLNRGGNANLVEWHKTTEA